VVGPDPPGRWAKSMKLNHRQRTRGACGSPVRKGWDSLNSTPLDLYHFSWQRGRLHHKPLHSICPDETLDFCCFFVQITKINGTLLCDWVQKWTDLQLQDEYQRSTKNQKTVIAFLYDQTNFSSSLWFWFFWFPHLYSEISTSIYLIQDS